MYRIGVDLGGTNIVAGVVDDEMKIVAKAKTKTALPRSAESIFDDIARISKEAALQAGLALSEIASIGIGTPGSVDKEAGVISYANNLDFDNVPAYKLLNERTGVKNIFIDNDATVAGLAEYAAGVSKGTHSSVFITNSPPH